MTRFLATLLPVIQFDANWAARPLVQALQWLHQTPDHDPPTTIVGKGWQRHVLQEDCRVDALALAFAFGALDKLPVAIRRRDVSDRPSWRYADPRAGLLAGDNREIARPIVCRCLGLSAQPDRYIRADTMRDSLARSACAKGRTCDSVRCTSERIRNESNAGRVSAPAADDWHKFFD